MSSFDLEAYSDSDYGGANLDRKSTTEVVNFWQEILITCNAKKPTIMAPLLLQRQNMLLLQIAVGKSILTISDEVHGVSWVFQESLGRDKDVPEGAKDSTAIETLKKIPPRV
ncbi:hypothetical protein Tco_0642256 [Tanacetum coccineum]